MEKSRKKIHLARIERRGQSATEKTRPSEIYWERETKIRE